VLLSSSFSPCVVLAVQKKVFRCLQGVAVTKTLSSVILAYSLRERLEEAFSQLELVVGSLHALWPRKWSHLVGDPCCVLCSFDLGLASLCLSVKPLYLYLLGRTGSHVRSSANYNSRPNGIGNSTQNTQNVRILLQLAHGSNWYREMCLAHRILDETGFMMGVAGTSKVVTSSDMIGRSVVIQPGNRDWVTAIECVNTSGWRLPPFLIPSGKLHQAGRVANNQADWHAGFLSRYDVTLMRNVLT
jgi:hypothetical protein